MVECYTRLVSVTSKSLTKSISTRLHHVYYTFRLTQVLRWVVTSGTTPKRQQSQFKWMASMTDNMNVVISYRGIYYNSGQGCQPLMMIAYDSRKDKFQKIQNLFKFISPSGTTPEGLCFRGNLKRVSQD